MIYLRMILIAAVCLAASLAMVSRPYRDWLDRRTAGRLSEGASMAEHLEAERLAAAQAAPPAVEEPDRPRLQLVDDDIARAARAALAASASMEGTRR